MDWRYRIGTGLAGQLGDSGGSESRITILPISMNSRFADDTTTTLDAKLKAQQLAFGPMLFQAVRVLRDSGALEHLNGCGKRGATDEQVAAAVQDLSLYAARILLEAGLAAGVLSLEEDGRYCITKAGFLVLRDPMTRVNFDFVHDVCYRGLFHLDEALRDGRPAGLATFGAWPTIYSGLAELPPQAKRSWFAFDHFYSDGVFSTVLPLVFASAPRRLVDVGGNTGKFAIACCGFSPEVHVTMVDHPGQLAKAREELVRCGLQARVTMHAMDMLDMAQPLPPGQDAYWMSQFLDCFSEPQIVGILRRAAAAMAPQSQLFILETFWDRQRYEAARLSVIGTSIYFAAMANGDSKMYHSQRMRACIEAAGLKVAQEWDEIGVSHTLLKVVKR
jgi:hypothetical protein